MIRSCLSIKISLILLEIFEVSMLNVSISVELLVMLLIAIVTSFDAVVCSLI